MAGHFDWIISIMISSWWLCLDFVWWLTIIFVSGMCICSTAKRIFILHFSTSSTFTCALASAFIFCDHVVAMQSHSALSTRGCGHIRLVTMHVQINFHVNILLSMYICSCGGYIKFLTKNYICQIFLSKFSRLNPNSSILSTFKNLCHTAYAA